LCLGEGKDFVVAKFTVWLSILAVLVMQRKVDCIYLGCQDGEELNPHGNECAIKDPLPPKGQLASHNMQSLWSCYNVWGPWLAGSLSFGILLQ